MQQQAKPLSGVETTKRESRGLRTGLAEDLAAPGGSVTEASYNLLKFHGSYEQYDRDTATPRKQQGLDKEWQFMVRVRAPGGRMTADQYLALDELAGRHANGTLRITTRQGIQFHGIPKGDLKATIAGINRTLLTSMSACGDVVRNVTTTPAPLRDAAHRRLEADAILLSSALLPRSRAHHEIFLDEAADPAALPEPEPLYGETFLPRKFKIALAHAADNNVDLLINDLGFLAFFDGDRLEGYQVCVGGGLGQTHNRDDTFPRLASPVGFVGPDDLLRAAEAVIRLYRDHGDRTDRKRARIKYLVEDRGVAWIRETLPQYYGGPMAPPRPMPRMRVPELLGWHEQGDGRCWLGVPVPSGRITDEGPARIRTALREAVGRFRADPTCTPQQDVLLTNLDPSVRGELEALLRGHGVVLADALTPLAKWALACPALPTCGLALTEAERVRAPIVAQVEEVMARHGLADERVVLRITGCPNGCARASGAEIGLVGRLPGQYALYVGGDLEGTRLCFKLVERLPEAGIAPALDALFAAFAAGREPGEGFGAFCTRRGEADLFALLPPPPKPVARVRAAA